MGPPPVSCQYSKPKVTMFVVSTMTAATNNRLTLDEITLSGLPRRTMMTSLAAAAVFAITSTANNQSMSGRAARGTGPGLAATASAKRTTMPSTMGTAVGGPRRIRAGARTCGESPPQGLSTARRNSRPLELARRHFARTQPGR